MFGSRWRFARDFFRVNRAFRQFLTPFQLGYSIALLSCAEFFLDNE
jgi:hypothetical protein